MQKIVVGFDGSEHGRRALERAAALAKTGATVTVVSAAPVTVLVRGGSAINPVDAEERDHALDDARSILAGAGVEANYVEGSGDPADVIVQEAERGGADLIIIGTRGLNFAQRWLLGSVSTKVVQHAPCDVLVVR
jgi:nucleotide-binding universal stress UspA family protein